MRGSPWFILAVVFLARTTMGYQFQSVGSVAPSMVGALAIDYAMLGTLIGLYQLPGIALAYPAGLLGRRIGEKPVAVMGLLLMAAGGLALAGAGSVGPALAGRTVSGVGAVLFNVMAAKMVADWFAGREVTVALAILLNSWPAGIALGLSSQASITEAASLEGMLLLVAGLCLAGMLLVLLFYRRPPGGAAGPPGGEPAGRLAAAEIGLVSLAGAIWLLFNGGLILVLSFAPDFLVAEGLEPAAAGRLVGLGTWLALVAVPFGGLLAQRRPGPDVTMLGCFLGAAAAAVAMALLEARLVPFLLFGLFGWAPASAVFALPVAVLRPEQRGPGLGLFLMYFYLGIGVIPPLGGWLRDLTGAPAAPMIFAAVLMLAAAVCLGLFRLAERRLGREAA